jgi:hypothetical protein
VLEHEPSMHEMEIVRGGGVAHDVMSTKLDLGIRGVKPLALEICSRHPPAGAAKSLVLRLDAPATTRLVSARWANVLIERVMVRHPAEPIARRCTGRLRSVVPDGERGVGKIENAKGR